MLLCKKYKALNGLKRLLLVILICVSVFSFAQEKQRILIEYAGIASSDEDVEEGALVFLRDESQQVHFIHKGVNLFCDKAIYYQDQII